MSGGIETGVLVLACGLAAWSLLAVAPTPSRMLWKPAVAATEWGHWLAGISLAVVAGALAGGAWRAALPALGAAALFASPSIRAARAAAGIGRGIKEVLGEPQNAHPRRRPGPFVIGDLLHIPIPPVEQSRHVYRAAEATPLTLDLYRRPDAGAPPVVVVIHGGSWSSGDSSQLAGMNRHLAAAGYAVAAINYRLAPRHRFPAPIEDIRAAIEFLKAEATRLDINPERIVLVGRSSGGHLALAAAYTLRMDVIGGVVALYAPTDLVWSWARPAPRRMMDSNAVIAAFLGGGPGVAPEAFERSSPIRHVRRDAPPTLLVHGKRDELVSPLQSRRMAAALEAVGARYHHIELPWGRHGMDANLAGPSGQITLYAIERFLDSVFRQDARRSVAERMIEKLAEDSTPVDAIGQL